MAAAVIGPSPVSQRSSESPSQSSMASPSSRVLGFWPSVSKKRPPSFTSQMSASGLPTARASHRARVLQPQTRRSAHASGSRHLPAALTLALSFLMLLCLTPQGALASHQVSPSRGAPLHQRTRPDSNVINALELEKAETQPHAQTSAVTESAAARHDLEMHGHSVAAGDHVRPLVSDVLTQHVATCEYAAPGLPV